MPKHFSTKLLMPSLARKKEKKKEWKVSAIFALLDLHVIECFVMKSSNYHWLLLSVFIIIIFFNMAELTIFLLVF